MKSFVLTLLLTFGVFLAANAKTYILYEQNGGRFLAVLDRDLDCDNMEWYVDVIDCWNALQSGDHDGVTVVAASITANNEIEVNQLTIGEL